MIERYDRYERYAIGTTANNKVSRTDAAFTLESAITSAKGWAKMKPGTETHIFICDEHTGRIIDTYSSYNFNAATQTFSY